MSDKMACPGCDSHTSSIATAVKNDEPCPHCNLSASAIREVNSARERGANAELTSRHRAALIRADRAEGEATALTRTYDRPLIAEGRSPMTQDVTVEAMYRIEITCPDGVVVTYERQTIRQVTGSVEVWATEPDYRVTITRETDDL